MPRMSGLELLRQLHESHPSLPVIVMSVFFDRRAQTEAFAYGARHLLEKPCGPDTILSTLEQILGPLAG